ncbi:hypothetical protein FHX44_118193 [Pseudonocardia hierapolitana]|uniref:Uncharacterized protein n=1 Tax=Pseudonocardia hierapolitana TaxID=1128676 RepID=A0A561T558_9PSEU|nr:hypothetical protein [Pseudonocardia hierapolitana]TWF82248.1 hypothetical protein FHX44_118193 [Pseudonocardia hierapolitana]
MSDLIEPGGRREQINFDNGDNTAKQEPFREDQDLPGVTIVPIWALASIVFGFLALIGSLVVISSVAAAAAIAWAIYAGRPNDGSGSRA